MRDNRRWLATPIVANGLIYLPEGSGRVTAFDAVSGDVVWIHDRRFPSISRFRKVTRERRVAIYRDPVLGNGGFVSGRAGCANGHAALGGEDG
jgi:outer membrane protein assembly factor BamB